MILIGTHVMNLVTLSIVKNKTILNIGTLEECYRKVQESRGMTHLDAVV